MIQLTPKDILQHRASWHDPATKEGARINGNHAKLLAADYQATKERLFGECVRAKLGVIPQAELLKGRLEVRQRGGFNWLCLDDEAIALFTDPKTEIRGFRYILTWHFKSLVDVGGN
jgi:hypothetical protein